MAVEDVRALVDRADAEPVEVARAARARLRDVSAETLLDHEQSIVAWALGLALRHRRELDEAATWLGRAIEGLVDGSDDQTRVGLTLAGVLAFRGEFGRAIAFLDGLSPSSELAPRVTFQRAAIAEHVGDVEAAAAGYEEALRLFEATGDRLGEAHALSGLGLVARRHGDAVTALERFGAARDVYLDLGLDMLAAAMRSNMGWAASRSGDLVGAIELFERAAAELRAHGESFIETELDLIEALMLLGRRTEATDRAVRVLTQLQSAGASADRAELLVALGEALAMSHHPDVAAQAFTTAERLFADQGRPSWGALVRLRRHLVWDDEASRGDLLAVGNVLREAGLTDAAADADVQVVERWRRGSTGAASSSSLDRAVDACLDRLLGLAADDPRRAFGKAVRAVGDDQFSRACEIAMRAIDRTVSVTIGATSLESRVAMARLRRHVTAVGASAARAGDDPQAVLRIIAALQRLALRPVGRGAWSTESEADWTVGRAVRPTDVRLVAVLDEGDELVCVSSEGAHAAFLDSPPRSAVLDLLERHDALLRTAIAGQPTAALTDLLDRTATELRSCLPWLSGEGPLALVATGALARAPWSSVADRPVRVVADLAEGALPSAGTTALVGPGLATARQEIALLGALLGDSLHVADGDPLGAIAHAGGATLHLCCHGHHDPINPMLSTYELDGGHVSAVEIEAVDRAPALVVAAACRAGATETSGTATALGLPTAWLAAGASTVVAPRCAIPDDDRTVATVVAIHGALADGATPEMATWQARTHGDETVARSLSVVGRLPTPALTT